MKVTALANGKRYVNGEGSPKNKSSSSSSSSSNAAAAVQVSFNLSCFRDVKDNEAVLLVGQTKQLGCWNVQQGVQLKSEEAAESEEPAKSEPGLDCEQSGEAEQEEAAGSLQRCPSEVRAARREAGALA